MIVADVSFNDIFWSVLWFFFLFIWLMVLFHVLTDLFRDHSVSGVEKTLWVLFLVFLPFLAVFIYLIVRGKGMGERAAAQQRAAQQEFEGYVRAMSPPRPRRHQPSRLPGPRSCWMRAPSTRPSSTA
jgi:hypothetical protein